MNENEILLYRRDAFTVSKSIKFISCIVKILIFIHTFSTVVNTNGVHWRPWSSLAMKATTNMISITITRSEKDSRQSRTCTQLHHRICNALRQGLAPDSYDAYEHKASAELCRSDLMTKQEQTTPIVDIALSRERLYLKSWNARSSPSDKLKGCEGISTYHAYKYMVIFYSP